MTKNKSIDFNAILNGIVKVIMIVLVIIFIYQVILKIIGKSPATEAVLITGIGIILTFLFSINTKVIKLEMNHKSLMDQFKRLAEDFKEHIKHK